MFEDHPLRRPTTTSHGGGSNFHSREYSNLTDSILFLINKSQLNLSCPISTDKESCLLRIRAHTGVPNDTNGQSSSERRHTHSQSSTKMSEPIENSNDYERSIIYYLLASAGKCGGIHLEDHTFRFNDEMADG